MAHGSTPPSDSQFEPVDAEQSTYMTEAQAEQLCSVFADGLDSGIGYARIFSLLERQGLSDSVVAPLREAVLERGEQLGEAFARCGILDPTARKMILVAEQQGKLPATFDELADIYETRRARKKHVAFAMVEPIVLTALGLIVFANIMSGNIVEMALSSDTGSQLTDIFVQSALECGIYGLAWFTAFYTWLNLPVDLRIRDGFNRIWLRVPFLSQPRRLFGVALFCRYLRQAIGSGLDVHRSLRLAADASGRPRLRSQIEDARARLKEGATLAEALYEVDALPEDVIDGIEVGETGGQLEERLATLAERYEEKSKDRFRRQMKVALWLIRYGIVVFVIGSMFMSIMSIEL